MPWTPSSFTPGVAWEDAPSTATPLDASDLNTAVNAAATYAATLASSVADYADGLAGGAGITSGDVSVTDNVATVNTVGGASSATIAAATYPPGSGQSAVSVLPFPTLLNTAAGYNDGPNLTTANGYEYAMWVSPAGHPTVGQRKLVGGGLPDGGGPWTYTDLSGTALGTQVNDGHNNYALEVDGNGYIHIIGNMHSVPLKYTKSNAPNSIASFSTGTMTGVNESLVTYPEFHPLPNGNLIFLYREGTDPGYNTYLKTYDIGTGLWSDTCFVFDGVTDGQTIYGWNMMLSQDGSKLGAAFYWRTVHNEPYSAHDVHYVQSLDYGATWQTVSGTPVTTPIRVSSPSTLIFPTAAVGSGLLGGGSGFAFDSLGNPHVAYLLNDANGNTNVQHQYWNGSSWQHEFVTFGTYQMSLNPPWVNGLAVVDGTVSRPCLFCDQNGGTFILWRARADGKRGILRIIDISIPGQPIENAIFAGDIGYEEALFYDQVAINSGKLRVFLLPTPYAIEGLGDTGDALNWASQWGAIMSVYTQHLRSHIGNVGHRSNVRPLSESHLSQGSTLAASTTSYVDIAGAPQIALDPNFATDGRVILAKLTASGSKATAGSGTFAITQKDHAGKNAQQIGSVTFALTDGVVIKTTPWVPLQLQYLPFGGTITVEGKSSDTNTVTATACSLDLGALEQPSGELIFGPTIQPSLPAEDSFITGVSTGTLWGDWDANVMSGVTASALTTLFDRSGNNQHFIPFGSTPVPILTLAAVNGRSAATFTGTQGLWLPVPNPPTPLFTIFLVWSPTVAQAACNALIASDPIPYNLTTSGGLGFGVQVDGSSNLKGFGYNTAGTSGVALQALSGAGYQVATIRRSATGVQAWVNGTSTAGETAIAGTPNTMTYPAPLTIGGRVTTAFGGTYSYGGTFTGAIQRVLIFSGALNTTDRQAVEVGLAGLCGIAGVT